MKPNVKYREIYWKISQNDQLPKSLRTLSWWISYGFIGAQLNRYQSCTQLQLFILRLFSMEVRLLPKTFGIINLDYRLGACGTPFCGTEGARNPVASQGFLAGKALGAQRFAKNQTRK